MRFSWRWPDGGWAEMRGSEAREIIIVIHQTSVAVSLDRPLKGRGKDARKGNGSPDELRFAILVGYDHEQERAVALRASFRRLPSRSSPQPRSATAKAVSGDLNGG